MFISIPTGGTAVAQWLRCRATNQKVAGLIPDGVTGIFRWHNTSDHTMALGSTQHEYQVIKLLERRCGVRQETSAHILREREALASLRHVYLGSFFLEPEDIKSLSLGAIWNFSKATGLPRFDMGHKGPCQLRPRCIVAVRSWTQMPIYLSKPVGMPATIQFSIFWLLFFYQKKKHTHTD